MTLFRFRFVGVDFGHILLSKYSTLCNLTRIFHRKVYQALVMEILIKSLKTFGLVIIIYSFYLEKDKSMPQTDIFMGIFTLFLMSCESRFSMKNFHLYIYIYILYIYIYLYKYLYIYLFIYLYIYIDR